MMLVDERKAQLLQLLAQTGRVIATDESQRMGVSEDTIRRDLRELARDGHLKRVHGGAVPLSPAVANYSSRIHISDAEKTDVGRCAAGMIEDGQLVFLDGGTTAVQLARSLRQDLRATIVTHSLSVALELAAHPHVTVEIIGGRLFRHSVVTVGAATLSRLSRYRPDICFMGATGVHPDQGITTGDSEEAEVKRFVVSISGAAYILASSEKIGAVSSFEITEFQNVDGIITTSHADDAALASLQSAGCNIIIANG
ncbi:DeoR/GlpR family DNA-binding transcription regulator [Agrobacterium rosae]|uniref:DeoR/GlpR family DNA-binding transcription regulator n=2 Tax=Agrobacterium rosae TaxID=1972867 RepID=A0ABU4VTT4_9HYPH|nr:DeoR/GlpR family DNA-binding transcription regulator [Agrobacterium rosae]MDX8328912.1 DeoR/GlpR family DNA-binding transcription regulator [Agrobacterium rosae]